MPGRHPPPLPYPPAVYAGGAMRGIVVALALELAAVAVCVAAVAVGWWLTH